MVWPLLAELGVALLKQDAQNREYQDAQRQHGEQTKMDIMGMRASRAGDSGYMQRALGASKSYPHNPDNGTGLLLGVASGLMAQKGAGDAEGALQDEHDITKRGPVDDGSIGGGAFEQGALPTYDDAADDWSNPNRRSPGLIGGAFNRSRGF
jgi:hypothetical protein